MPCTSAGNPVRIHRNLNRLVCPGAVELGAIVCSEEHQVEHRGLPFFEYRAVAFDEIFEGQFSGAFGCLDTGLGRGISGIRLLDDRSDIDDERQWFVLTDDLTPRCLAVGQLAGDVELELCAGLHADESVVPPGDDLCVAEWANGEGVVPRS